jgi:hypothetical protein
VYQERSVCFSFPVLVQFWLQRPENCFATSITISPQSPEYHVLFHFTFADHQLVLFRVHFGALDVHPIQAADHTIGPGRVWVAIAAPFSLRPGRPGIEPESRPTPLAGMGQNRRISQEDDLRIEISECVFVGMLRINRPAGCAEKLVFPFEKLRLLTKGRNPMCIAIKFIQFLSRCAATSVTRRIVPEANIDQFHLN